MPIKKCKKGKKTGRKYGTTGKCYVGKGSERKAQKQAAAIKISQKRRGRR